MAKQTISAKRLQIDRAKANVVVFVSVAAFVTVFSLVSSKALLGKRSFQARVITEKETTLNTLKSNNDAATKLVASYKTFNSAPDNLLGGNPSGSGDKDGENSKLILDSLPSRYDFPGLTSSVEKMITSQGSKIESISGTDDEIAQSAAEDSSKPVEMPFQVDAKNSPDGIQRILQTFGKSIRPMTITKLTFTVENSSSMRVSINAKSYYQPKKVLEIKTKVVQ